MRILPLPLICAGTTLMSLSSLCVADAPKQSPEGVAFFETHIRPVLVAECMDCHGAEKQKAGLRLDSRAGWQKGGESGVVIVPGKPDSSLLLSSIKHLDPDLKMPEKAPKLDASVIQNFTRWIEMGAPDPRDAPTAAAALKPAWPDLLAARRNWWCLQPIIEKLQPPTEGGPSNTDHMTHPVDRFLNASLAQAGIEPAAAASATTLVRRLHFLLTGLPPKPDEVRSFALAHARDAESAVRTRAQELMALPAFGEHWARHWMDLVRYAESHGSEGDPEIPGAFQYRDYLIRAFNADVPLDRLIQEHIAGDLLPDARISATGVNESRIGPAHFRMGEHGYQPVDTLDDQVKMVDNQIDVVTKAFQGLTVSCARCHDHKFDAISQRDYTALYGIFSSLRPAQVLIDSDARLQLDKKEELKRLKTVIRKELSTHWASSVKEFESSLKNRLRPPQDENLTQLQERLRILDDTLAQKQWGQTQDGKRHHSPAPYALWTFSQGAEEHWGRVPSTLVGGARVEDGALVLDGKGAYLQTSPLPVSFTERTLEAWLSTTNLEQRGGGIAGLEQIKNHTFDTIVYGEKKQRKWLSGSNNHRRSEQTDGVDETAQPSERVHVSITYASDGMISVFRNGLPYGAPYRKDGIATFEADDCRLLIGLRHTGAQTGFFEGKIHEARLYSRALTAEEVAKSYAEGPLAAIAPTQTHPKQEDAALQKMADEAKALRAEIARLTPAQKTALPLAAAAAPEHPLHLALKAATLTSEAFTAMAPAYREKLSAKIAEAKAFNAENFKEAWNLTDTNRGQWFTNGPDVELVQRGDFRIRTAGDDALDDLLPAGIAAASLVPQFGGIAASPDFKITYPNISVRFAANNGAMLRIIPENYPLGIAPIFPRAIVQRDVSAWTRLDTSYRVNSNAYVECTTPAHQTRRAEAPKGGAPFEKDAFFVIESVLFHEGKEAPREVYPALEMVLTRCKSNTRAEFLTELRTVLEESVTAWKSGTLREDQRELLSAVLRCKLLPTEFHLSPKLETAVTQYRTLTSAMPTPASAPGVLEHQGKDAPFLTRGDFKKPGELVQRAFLEVLDFQPITSSQSGRLELAHKILSPSNPLTARVMANRIWLWTFGAGIVPTPDNFGRMGEKPTHPELLDFLALQLQKDGWSLKKLLASLVQTQAFQRSSTESKAALEKDPGNALLSHAHVRRLEAESIRDAMLSVSGVLDPAQMGPSVPAHAPRRSIYLQQRRNSLPAFLTTFDAPKPFTTLGRRDSTTVPAQSLTLLNDPAILQFAKQWSNKAKAATTSPEERIHSLFEAAFGRPATLSETAQSKQFLAETDPQGDLTPLAHALFNLKEFIYLR